MYLQKYRQKVRSSFTQTLLCFLLQDTNHHRAQETRSLCSEESENNNNYWLLSASNRVSAGFNKLDLRLFKTTFYLIIP